MGLWRKAGEGPGTIDTNAVRGRGDENEDAEAGVDGVERGGGAREGADRIGDGLHTGSW